MGRYFYLIPPQKREMLADLEGELKSWFKARPFERSVSFSEDDVVVVCGGDGGLNFAINQLIDTEFKISPTIIYVPCGTGNDFARAATPFEGQAPSEWFQLCNQGVEKRFPLVACNDRAFINVASGLNVAEVTGQASKEAKNIMGTFVYYLNGLSKLGDLKLYRGRCSQRGVGPLGKKIGEEIGEEKDLLGFIVANGVYAGGGIKVKSNETISDQSFETLLIGDNSGVRLLELLVRLQAESSDLSDLNAWAFNSKEIRLNFLEKVKVNLDGEAYESKDFTFKHIPSAVRFKLPYESLDTK